MRRGVRRTGTIHVAWLAFLASAAALAVLIGLLAWEPRVEKPAEPLVVYCAAGTKVPVEAAAREYEATYGVRVQLQYGPSETLLVNLRLSRQGDLYLPADDSYLRQAEDRGLVKEVVPLAEMTPVVVFTLRPAGSPVAP